MNWAVNLAKSLDNDKTLVKHQFIQFICQIAIALCITTVLISSFLIRGFEEKVEEKIFSFWSHIRISNLSLSTNQIVDNPLQIDLNSIKHPQIESIQPVVNKGVILKHQKNIEGIVLKGINLLSTQYQVNYTQKVSMSYDTRIEVPIILSNNSLNKLNTKIGSIIYIHIIDSIPQIIKAKVVNTYFTNIDEFDNQIALTDIHLLQKLNHWNKNEYSWVEVQVKEKNQIIPTSESLYGSLNEVNVESIYTLFPQLFDWLALMKRNEIIILIVMLIVAIINVISTISIFILEKTRLIGMLKVLGARDKELFKMMIYNIFKLILKGILWGNVLTIIITAILYYLKPIHLDPSVYYIDYAPIKFEWIPFIIINILTILVSLMSTLIPLQMIKKISPVKIADYR